MFYKNSSSNDKIDSTEDFGDFNPAFLSQPYNNNLQKNERFEFPSKKTPHNPQKHSKYLLYSHLHPKNLESFPQLPRKSLIAPPGQRSILNQLRSWLHRKHPIDYRFLRLLARDAIILRIFYSLNGNIPNHQFGCSRRRRFDFRPLELLKWREKM